MLRAVRGFDCVSTDGAPLLFNGATGDDVQRAMVPGRDGNGFGLFLFNTAFGEVFFTINLDAQATWFVHFDYANAVSGQTPNYAVQKFLEIGAVYLQQRSDGKIDVFGPAGLICTSSVAIPAVAQDTAANYVGIELRVSSGSPGSVELRFDGTTVASGNTALPGMPSTITFHQQGFGPPGYIIDNLVIWDGQPGDQFTTFQGRMRVSTLVPTSDVVTNWSPNSGSNCFSRVDSVNGGVPNAGPFGDSSFIDPGAGDPDQLFTVSAPGCYGKIYAVAVSSCARPTSGSPTLNYLYVGSGGSHVVGTVHPAFVGRWNTNEPLALKDYSIYQALVVNNPDTGAGWTDPQLTNGEFGVGAQATPTLRVSLFYVEKVVSLVPQPFDCGGGNYSY